MGVNQWRDCETQCRQLQSNSSTLPGLHCCRDGCFSKAASEVHDSDDFQLSVRPAALVWQILLVLSVPDTPGNTELLLQNFFEPFDIHMINPLMWRAHFVNAIESIAAFDNILENIDGRISCAIDHRIWHIYIHNYTHYIYIYIYTYDYMH